MHSRHHGGDQPHAVSRVGNQRGAVRWRRDVFWVRHAVADLTCHTTSPTFPLGLVCCATTIIDAFGHMVWLARRLVGLTR